MTRPPGSMSAWTLGLANRSPTMRSSTTAPTRKLGDEPRGQPAQLPAQVLLGLRVVAAGRSSTRLPTPEALLSSLTTTERASGRAAWTASAARTTPSIGAEVLPPDRHRDSGLGEHPPPPALVPQRGQGRRRAVDRQLQPDGDLDLGGGDVVRVDEPRATGDEVADLVQQVRTIQQLGGQRPQGRVLGGHQVRPPGHVRAITSPGQVQVVVPHRRVRGHRHHEDHRTARQPTQHREHQQEPVLQGRQPGTVVHLDRPTETQRRQHHHDMLGRGFPRGAPPTPSPSPTWSSSKVRTTTPDRPSPHQRHPQPIPTRPVRGPGRRAAAPSGGLSRPDRPAAVVGQG